MRAVTFSQRLPSLALLPPLLPIMTFSARLPKRNFSERLPTVRVPIFPVSTDDPQALKDALGDFILGADGDNLWGAPN